MRACMRTCTCFSISGDDITWEVVPNGSVMFSTPKFSAEPVGLAFSQWTMSPYTGQLALDGPLSPAWDLLRFSLPGVK